MSFLRSLSLRGWLILAFVFFHCVAPIFVLPLFVAASFRMGQEENLQPQSTAQIQQPDKSETPISTPDEKPIAIPESQPQKEPDALPAIQASTETAKKPAPPPDLQPELEAIRKRLAELEGKKLIPAPVPDEKPGDAKPQPKKPKFIVEFSCPQTRMLRFLDPAMVMRISRFLSNNQIPNRYFQRSELIAPGRFALVHYLSFQKLARQQKTFRNQEEAAGFAALLRTLGIESEVTTISQ